MKPFSQFLPDLEFLCIFFSNEKHPQPECICGYQQDGDEDGRKLYSELQERDDEDDPPKDPG